MPAKLRKNSATGQQHAKVLRALRDPKLPAKTRGQIEAAYHGGDLGKALAVVPRTNRPLARANHHLTDPHDQLEYVGQSGLAVGGVEGAFLTGRAQALRAVDAALHRVIEQEYLRAERARGVGASRRNAGGTRIVDYSQNDVEALRPVTEFMSMTMVHQAENSPARRALLRLVLQLEQVLRTGRGPKRWLDTADSEGPVWFGRQVQLQRQTSDSRRNAGESPRVRLSTVRGAAGRTGEHSWGWYAGAAWALQEALQSGTEAAIETLHARYGDERALPLRNNLFGFGAAPTSPRQKLGDVLKAAGRTGEHTWAWYAGAAWALNEAMTFGVETAAESLYSRYQDDRASLGARKNRSRPTTRRVR